jgi:hypothetical protein
MICTVNRSYSFLKRFSIWLICSPFFYRFKYIIFYLLLTGINTIIQRPSTYK